MVPRETRSKPFKVNLTPSMHARLEVLAERLGMAPSTLATVAISEYVAQKNSALESANTRLSQLQLLRVKNGCTPGVSKTPSNT